MLSVIDIDHIKYNYNFKTLKLGNRAGGLTALNYFAKADDKDIFIKQYSKDYLNKIITAAKISQLANDYHIPTPIILNNIYDQKFTEIKDKIFVIYPKIEGKILHGTQLSKKVLIETSKYLAKLHQLPRLDISVLSIKNLSINNSKFDLNPLNSEISNIIKESTKIKSTFLEQIKLNNNFNDLLKEQCLIHGDFHNENILFNKANELVALLDFDEARFGSHSKDIISFIMLGLCNDGFNESDIAKAKLLCQNYNQHALKPINRTMMEQGLLYYLYKLCQSSFLEHKLATLPSNNLALMIERDISKVKYLQRNISSLSSLII